MSDAAANAVQPIESTLLQEDADLRDIVVEFVEQLPQRFAAIQQAAEAQDWEQLRRFAHQLKGAGGSYGYPPISAICAQVEQHAEDHAIEQITSELKTLNALITAARRGLGE